MTQARVPWLAPLALCALSTQLSAEVLEVRGPSPDYFEIQAAVLAASDGDTIRVWGGEYAAVFVEDKDLRIVAANGTVPTVAGTVRAHDLSAGKTLLLSGLRVESTESAALILYQCSGRVRVEGCELRGYSGDHIYPGVESAVSAARVEGCADVVLQSCELQGGQPGSVGDWDQETALDGGDGLNISGSTVSLYDSAVRGGWGSDIYDVTFAEGGWGGDGIDAGDSTVYLSGSTVEGGDGGRGGDGSLFELGGAGGPGGDGLSAHQSTVRTLDTLLVGGLGGPGGVFGGGSGAPGLDIRLNGSTLSELDGVARSLSAPRFEAELGTMALTFRGAPGDAVFLVGSLAPAYRYSPFWHGPLLLQAPFEIDRLFLGVTDGNGDLQVQVVTPAVPPLQALTLHLQGAHLSSGGSIYLGAATTVTVLDGGI